MRSVKRPGPVVRSSRGAARIPFFAPIAATRVRRCWATNLSLDGIGLSGFAVGDVPPEPGDELELEFTLGETQEAIRAIGRIVWTGRVHVDGRLGLGIQFSRISARARAALALFVADHRPRVLVALAGAGEKQLVRTLDLQVELVDHLDELDSSFAGACATIVVF